MNFNKRNGDDCIMANTRDEVNISKLYGQECLLSKKDFIEKIDPKEQVIIVKLL